MVTSSSRGADRGKGPRGDDDNEEGGDDEDAAGASGEEEEVGLLLMGRVTPQQVQHNELYKEERERRGENSEVVRKEARTLML
jgi:hypothetical protein